MAKRKSNKTEEPYGLRLARHANPDAAKKAREIAFGGGWGSHDLRPNRLRTRGNVKRNAIRDYS